MAQHRLRPWRKPRPPKKFEVVQEIRAGMMGRCATVSVNNRAYFAVFDTLFDTYKIPGDIRMFFSFHFYLMHMRYQGRGKNYDDIV